MIAQDLQKSRLLNKRIVFKKFQDRSIIALSGECHYKNRKLF